MRSGGRLKNHLGSIVPRLAVSKVGLARRQSLFPVGLPTPNGVLSRELARFEIGRASGDPLRSRRHRETSDGVFRGTRGETGTIGVGRTSVNPGYVFDGRVRLVGESQVPADREGGCPVDLGDGS